MSDAIDLRLAAAMHRCDPLYALRAEILATICARPAPTPWRMQPALGGVASAVRPDVLAPFDLAAVGWSPEPDVLLIREDAPSYEILVWGSRSEIVGVAPADEVTRPPSALDEPHAREVLALFDDIATLVHPWIGFVDRPSASRERVGAAALLDDVAFLDGVGPIRLGARTWMGRPLLAHLPVDRLRALLPAPSIVRETAWGAVVDLVPDLVRATPAEIETAFVAAMQALAATGVFARAIEDGRDFEPASWWKSADD